MQYLSDFRMLQVILVEFQLHLKHHSITNTASALNDGYVWIPSADLCAIAAHKMVSLQNKKLFESKGKSAASGASTDDKYDSNRPI